MQPAVTVTILGLSGSGKTSIVRSLINNNQEIFPTPGFQISYLTSNSRCILIYDCSGEGHQRSNWQLFGPLADCLIYVIDSKDTAAFSTAKKHLLIYLGRVKHTKKPHLCIMLNKSDIKQRPPKQVLYKALEVDKLNKLVNKLYVKQTSAYNKEGLDECIDWISKNCKSKNDP